MKIEIQIGKNQLVGMKVRTTRKDSANPKGVIFLKDAIVLLAEFAHLRADVGQ